MKYSGRTTCYEHKHKEEGKYYRMTGYKMTPFFQDIEDELFSLEKEFGTEKFNLLGRDPETMEIALNNASDTELVVINCEMDGAVFKYKGKEIGSVKAPEEVRSLLKEHKLI